MKTNHSSSSSSPTTSHHLLISIFLHSHSSIKRLSKAHRLLPTNCEQPCRSSMHTPLMYVLIFPNSPTRTELPLTSPPPPSPTATSLPLLAATLQMSGGVPSPNPTKQSMVPSSARPHSSTHTFPQCSRILISIRLSRTPIVRQNLQTECFLRKFRRGTIRLWVRFLHCRSQIGSVGKRELLNLIREYMAKIKRFMGHSELTSYLDCVKGTSFALKEPPTPSGGPTTKVKSLLPQPTLPSSVSPLRTKRTRK